jgi:protein SCO1
MKLSPMAIGMTLGAVLMLLAGGLFFARTSVIVSVHPPAPLPVPAPPSAPGTNLQTYFVRGVVKELKPDGRTLIVDHEEIPNYMAKMVMPFKVKATNDLAGLGTNDQIHFRLNVAEFESWIDQVTKTGKAPVPAADPNRRSFRPVREVEVLKEGDPLPNYPLTNQLGQPFQTAQFKGRALAITFIFTRCPLPDFCPRMSRNFVTAMKQLKARPAGPTNYHFLSLSFDVEHDTPATLRNYAKGLEATQAADLSRWTFATGALIEIDDITERFGLAFARDPGSIQFNHNLRTVVIDAVGRVQKIFIGNEWKSDELVTEMIKAAEVKP